MVRLHDNSSALGVIKEEGTWFATKNLETEPAEGLCELLLPRRLRGSNKSSLMK
ncbi:MAG: hypothetical protein ACXAEU_00490 [Candidatus Hodarchaeales archaeon]